MNITLNPELGQRVRERVKRGEYESAEAFVQQAVQRLIEDDEAEDEEIDDIRRRIQEADAEIDQGNFVEFDQTTVRDLARDVHQRGMKTRRPG